MAELPSGGRRRLDGIPPSPPCRVNVSEAELVPALVGSWGVDLAADPAGGSSSSDKRSSMESTNCSAACL